MSSSAIRFSAMPPHEMVLVVANLDGIIVDALGPTNKVCGWNASALHGKALGESLIPESLRKQHFAGLKTFGLTGKAPALGHTFATEVTGQENTVHAVWLTVFGVAADLMFGLLEYRHTGHTDRETS